MTQERRDQLVDLVQADDGALAKELETADSKEAFLAAFARKGIELTSEEADELLLEIVPAEKAGELNENDLESVAGGISLKAAIAAWKAGVRVGIVARMIYDKLRYNNAYKNYNWDNFLKGKVGLNFGPISL